MGKSIDLVGCHFGRLTVIEKTNQKKYGKTLWRCLCECGNLKYATSSGLKSGDVKSCGCMQKETQLKNLDKYRKHNIKHGMSNSRLYRIYYDMTSRCYRKSINGYENYGGRGIRVCNEWIGEFGFINFMKWAIENGYNDSLTIDRVDSNSDYAPCNCRWATRKEQANNTRATIFLEYGGERHTISEWSELTGIGRNIIYSKFKKGISVGRALGYEQIV